MDPCEAGEVVGAEETVVQEGPAPWLERRGFAAEAAGMLCVEVQRQVDAKVAVTLDQEPLLAVDCHAEDFDDFEGATDIYVDLDGHWAMDVTLRLRAPHSSYPLTLRPRFIYEPPRWSVVDADGEVYAVAGRARHPIAPGVVDCGYTFVPFYTRAEKAIWMFQSAREVWSFIAVDGGCSPERGFVQTCGFELGRKVNVNLAFQSEMLQCSAHGCYFGDDWVWPYLCNQEEECLWSPTTMYGKQCIMSTGTLPLTSRCARSSRSTGVMGIHGVQRLRTGHGL